MAPVGRDGEVAAIYALLSVTSAAPAALAITGDAGIGKIIVWKDVVQGARKSSAYCLANRPRRKDRSSSRPFMTCSGPLLRKFFRSLRGPAGAPLFLRLATIHHHHGGAPLPWSKHCAKQRGMRRTMRPRL